MHIPDGYLGPQTYVPLYGASAAFWTVGLSRLSRQLDAKQVPYLSMAAAFSFLVMMFNVPVPGGTTGHAVGAAIIAILLGPWTAVIAVSVVLIIQAVVFGDGGITAIGADCFNMAVVMPFVSYWTYHAVKGKGDSRGRLYAAAFLSGYLGIFASSVATGIEFGIQPMIASAPDGTPLYAPYPLSIALPAMALGHLVFFGPLEGLMTMLLVAYFLGREPVYAGTPGVSPASRPRRALWIGIAIIALLTPLGVILPRLMGAGGAWGEWSTEELGRMLGSVPEGLRRLSELWKAPLADYGLGEDSGMSETVSYLITGVIGVGATIGAIYIVSRAVVSVRRRAAGAGAAFIDKGIHHIAKVVRTSYIQWETASRSGLLQGLDARVKVLFTAFFLVVVSLRREIAPELMVFAFVFALAAASRLDLVSLYRRVLFFGFFFGFIIAFPSSLNIVREGDVVLPLVSLSGSRDIWIYHIPAEVGITREGLRGVALLTMRVVDSVSLSLLLLYTTPFPEIIRALKMMRVPDTFLMIINLTYKYIFVFARTVEDMHLARKSRQLGAIGGSEARGWIAGRIALVFKKTQLQCEELYKAMLSRGFTGEVRLLELRKACGRDYAAGLGLIAAGVVFLFI